MALLQGRCLFFEASEELCPDLAQSFGPSPAVMLMSRGRSLWRLGASELGEQCAEGIAREVEQQINEADNARLVMSPTSSKRGVADMEWGIGPVSQSLSLQAATDSMGAAESESMGARRSRPSLLMQPSLSKSLGSAVSMTRDQAWAFFLELAGLPEGSPLVKLAEHVAGPKTFCRGEVLLHKGAATSIVFFVVDGMVSLWNEGHGHDQDAVGPQLPSAEQDDLSPTLKTTITRSGELETQKQHSTMLTKGTSRLLRIGPGWVLGGLPPLTIAQQAGWRPQLVPLTHVAESRVTVLELGDEAARGLEALDPVLLVALQELLAHFAGVFQQHTLAQLSDWHVLAYAQQASAI